MVNEPFYYQPSTSFSYAAGPSYDDYDDDGPTNFADEGSMSPRSRTALSEMTIDSTKNDITKDRESYVMHRFYDKIILSVVYRLGDRSDRFHMIPVRNQLRKVMRMKKVHFSITMMILSSTDPTTTTMAKMMIFYPILCKLDLHPYQAQSFSLIYVVLYTNYS